MSTKPKIQIEVGKLIDRRGRVFLRAARLLDGTPSMNQAGTALFKSGAGFMDYLTFASLYQPGNFRDKEHRVWALLFADEIMEDAK